MNKEQEKQNVRRLLFTDFSISPEKARLYLNDMENNPHKVPRYGQLLIQNLSKQYESIKEKSLEDLKRMAKQRAEEWSRLVGPLTTQDFVSMSKQWDIPIDGIIKEKITPELIKEMLDAFVIGQEDYKIKLSVAFYTYLMHGRQAGMELPKCNLLVCGPSGSGKTYGMQILTKLFHVPFVIVHCNNLVQEGIIGPGLTDGFTSLITQGWSAEDVERAVVCFDEFDKLFAKDQKGGESGYYNARVVNEMLNIIDDKGEVEFSQSFEKHSGKPIKLPTRRMMFVFTGVFDGLRNQAGFGLPKNRRKIGFRTSYESQEKELGVDLNKELTLEDFVEFGVKPEIMGRVQNCVFLNELTEDDMVALFDMGNCSPFNEFEQYFSSNGIDTILTDEGKHTLARLACERGLGVRGLKSLLQQVLMEDMYDLDVGEDNILRVTKEYIIDNLNK